MQIYVLNPPSDTDYGNVGGYTQLEAAVRFLTYPESSPLIPTGSSVALQVNFPMSADTFRAWDTAVRVHGFTTWTKGSVTNLASDQWGTKWLDDNPLPDGFADGPQEPTPSLAADTQSTDVTTHAAGEPPIVQSSDATDAPGETDETPADSEPVTSTDATPSMTDTSSQTVSESAPTDVESVVAFAKALHAAIHDFLPEGL